jgi:hypothetical protein
VRGNKENLGYYTEYLQIDLQKNVVFVVKRVRKNEKSEYLLRYVCLSLWRTVGGWGFHPPPPPPKFQSFNKAELNSQFRGKYIRTNLIRIQV